MRTVEFQKKSIKVLVKLFQKFVTTGKKPGHPGGVAFSEGKRGEGWDRVPRFE